MRHILRRVVAVTAVLAIAAGCANPETEPAAETPSDTDETDDTSDDDDGPDDAAPAEGYAHLARALEGEFAGSTVTVLSQWIAEDGERFNDSLDAFRDATGIDVQVDGVADYTTTLVARAEGGNPPDVAQIAQPGLMRTLAGNGHLVAISDWIDMDQLTAWTATAAFSLTGEERAWERGAWTTPDALGRSPIVTHATASSTTRLTFHSAVTSEISESLSAFDRASVDSVWQTPNTAHQATKPGLSTGKPPSRQPPSANGSRKVKRPQTLMYSSSACPRRFMAVLRSTWNSAAAIARTSHMVRDCTRPPPSHVNEPRGTPGARG